MENLFDQLPEVLAWIQDEPFRLFAVLAIGVAVIVFLFFRNEGPAYKLVATILLFGGVAAIAYTMVIEQSEPDLSETFPEVDPSTSDTIDLIKLAAQERCFTDMHGKISAIAQTFPADADAIWAAATLDIMKEVTETPPMARSSTAPGCNRPGVIARGVSVGCSTANDTFYAARDALRDGDLQSAEVQARMALTLFQTCA